MDGAVVERLRALHPETTASLLATEAEAAANTDPSILQLCHHRLAHMLGGEVSSPATAVDPAKLAALDSWWDSPLFTDAERAHLAFTEQYVLSVGSISDADVDKLLEFGSPRQVYDFVNALFVMDQVQRLEMVARVVL